MEKAHVNDSSPKAESTEADSPSSHVVIGENIAFNTKSFSLWSAAALGYSITNSASALLQIIGPNNGFGGPVLFVYGYLFMAGVALAVAVTLGELASAYPHTGGQYYWVSQLAPERGRRFWSYMVAICSWASPVCVGAASLVAASNFFFQIYAFYHPDLVYRPWMGFLLYQLGNISMAFFNLYERWLPRLYQIVLAYSVLFIVVIFICLLAPGSPRAPASDLFTLNYNISGWPNGVSYLIGLNGCNWAFSCLDAVTHMAQEIPQPRKNIPKALLCTIAIGFVVGYPLIIAIYLVVDDVAEFTNIVDVAVKIYGSYATPIVIGSLAMVAALVAMIGIHTWQARIAWALSQDKGFPFHKWLSQLAPSPYETPLWAHLWSSTWTALLGFLYLGSTTAFNSLVSASITLQYITYAVPVIFLLKKGRSNFPHGPFWFPRLGLVCNIILLAWTLFTIVIYSLPYYLPVSAGDMNYVSVVLVFFVLYALAYWLSYGYKHFKLVSTVAFDDWVDGHTTSLE